MEPVRAIPNTTVYIDVTDAGQVIILDRRFSSIQVIVTNGNSYLRFGNDSLVGGDVVVAGASLANRDVFMINTSSEKYATGSHTKLAFRTTAGTTATVHVNYIY